MRFAQAPSLRAGSLTLVRLKVAAVTIHAITLIHFDSTMVQLKTLHENHQEYYTRSL